MVFIETEPKKAYIKIKTARNNYEFESEINLNNQDVLDLAKTYCKVHNINGNDVIGIDYTIESYGFYDKRIWG